MLNLKHLYYFHVFAKELSVTKAAKKLQLTPPALANQLKALENFIGWKLYTRETGKIRLTNKGEIVCQYAKRIFSPYEELISFVQSSTHA
jgi:LysR family transcriptional activator of nhaA